MFTPQEVSERAFPKAGFGGYNMALVDEFLDQLTEDYTALYKENAALKSKMKVLVEKIEEYRSTEEAMRKALLTAQRMADDMVKEAEEKRDYVLSHAEEEARKKVQELGREIAAEEQRLADAKTVTAAFVAKLKELYRHEMDYLGGLSQLAPAPEAVSEPPQKEPVLQAAYPEPEEELEDTKEMDARQVRAQAEERPGGLYGDLTATFLDVDGETERKLKVNPERRTADRKPLAEEDGEAAPSRISMELEELQFGKDFELH